TVVRPRPSSSAANTRIFSAPANSLVAPALMVRARYTRDVRLLLVDASIIKAIPVGFTRPDLKRREIGREHRVGCRIEQTLDLRIILASNQRARHVDEPASGTKQRPQRIHQPALQLRGALDVRRGSPQLDIRMPPDHAERAARRIEQDPVERLAVPPLGGSR